MTIVRSRISVRILISIFIILVGVINSQGAIYYIEDSASVDESSNSFDKTGFSGIRIFVPESKITSKVNSGYYYITRDDPLVKALLDYGVKEKGLDVILPID